MSRVPTSRRLPARFAGLLYVAALVGAEAPLACGDGGRGNPLALGEVVVDEVRDLPSRREIDLRWGSAGATLSGTLYLPEGRGPFPVVVAHFGSDRWTRATFASGFTKSWVFNGYGLLSYDKRGVGASGGTCCPWSEPGYFELLAEDVLGGVRAIRGRPEVDVGRIGLWGFSQGGWIVPIAAVKGGDEVAFTIIGSGPAVSVGQEILYSRLSGDADCRRSGLSEEELDRRLDEEGPSGFDPRPWLERMRAPGLWIYGGADTSVPVLRSIRILEEIREERDLPFTIQVVPDANHVWILGGGPCEFSGRSFGWVPSVFGWLRGPGRGSRGTP